MINIYNMRTAICAILFSVSLMRHDRLISADVDVMSWKSIRDTRPLFYNELMLCSINELRAQNPEVKKITRIVVVAGWNSGTYAVTLFEKKEGSSVLFEIKSSNTMDTWLRVKLPEEKEIRNVTMLIKQAIGSLNWGIADKGQIADDEGMILYERYEEGVSNYVVKGNAALSETSLEAVRELDRVVRMLSKEREGK